MPTYLAELGALPATIEPRLTVWLEGTAPNEAAATMGMINEAGRKTQNLLSKRDRKAGKIIAFEVLSVKEVAP